MVKQLAQLTDDNFVFKMYLHALSRACARAGFLVGVLEINTTADNQELHCVVTGTELTESADAIAMALDNASTEFPVVLAVQTPGRLTTCFDTRTLFVGIGQPCTVPRAGHFAEIEALGSHILKQLGHTAKKPVCVGRRFSFKATNKGHSLMVVVRGVRALDIVH